MKDVNRYSDFYMDYEWQHFNSLTVKPIVPKKRVFSAGFCIAR